MQVSRQSWFCVAMENVNYAGRCSGFEFNDTDVYFWLALLTFACQRHKVAWRLSMPVDKQQLHLAA